jgi:hypothetical protein
MKRVNFTCSVRQGACGQVSACTIAMSYVIRKPIVSDEWYGKVIPLQARCGQRVGRGIALLFHDLGTRSG